MPLTQIEFRFFSAIVSHMIWQGFASFCLDMCSPFASIKHDILNMAHKSRCDGTSQSRTQKDDPMEGKGTTRMQKQRANVYDAVSGKHRKFVRISIEETDGFKAW